MTAAVDDLKAFVAAAQLYHCKRIGTSLAALDWCASLLLLDPGDKPTVFATAIASDDAQVEPVPTFRD